MAQREPTVDTGSRRIGQVAALALTLRLLCFDAAPVDAGGLPAGGADRPLLYLAGAGAGSGAGDWVSAADGFDEAHRFFIEVPPGTRTLEIDLFDADVAAGTAPGEVDKVRGAARDTRVRYELYDPAGRRAATRFVTAGDRGLPAADRAWLTFFSSRTTVAGGERFTDTFDSASYDRNDGSQPFSGPWTEPVRAAGTGFDSGDVRIRDGRLELSNLAVVRPRPRPPSIERELDLSRFAAASVAFDFATSPEVDPEDEVLLEVSADAGDSYRVVEELIGLGGGVSGHRVYDISDRLAKRTRLRFRVGDTYVGPGETFSIDNLEIRAAGTAAETDETAPPPGRWELVVDMSSRINREPESGDDVNALGIRVHDGDPGHGGSELSIYAESFLPVGTYGRPGSAEDYALFAYVSGGCAVGVRDFDWDATAGFRAGSLQLVSRNGAFVFSDPKFGFSADRRWNLNLIEGWTTAGAATEYGVWSLAVEIADPAAGNFGTLRLEPAGDRAGLASRTQAPSGRALRIYLPDDRGGAPVKPFLGHSLYFVDGTANPPAADGRGVYALTLRLVNPAGTAGAVSFEADHAVTATVPQGVSYLGAEMSAGSLRSQPEHRSSGQIAWSPGTLSPGSEATLTYQVEVVVEEGAPAQPVEVTGRPGAGGTRAEFLDEVGWPFVLGELCQLSVPLDAALPALAPKNVAAASSATASAIPGKTLQARAEVRVLGEVKEPGSYPYRQGTTVLDAIALAGGPTRRGAVKGALVRRLEGGEETLVKVMLEDLLLPGDTLHIPLSSWYQGDRPVED